MNEKDRKPGNTPGDFNLKDPVVAGATDAMLEQAAMIEDTASAIAEAADSLVVIASCMLAIVEDKGLLTPDKINELKTRLEGDDEMGERDEPEPA